MQEGTGLKKVIEQGIWGNIKEFLNYELLYIGSETGPVIFTVGLVLSFILAIIVANLSSGESGIWFPRICLRETSSRW